jgi:hypothetical protein
MMCCVLWLSVFSMQAYTITTVALLRVKGDTTQSLRKECALNVKKSLLVAGAVATVGVTGIAGLGVASAATDSSTTKSDGMSSLVDKIADKFNLNKQEVEAVFEEERTEREAEMQQKLEERLTQAVTDGKITEAQKDKILAKHKELKSQMESNREAMKDKTKDEIRTLMEQQREELQTWAEENDIPEEYMHIAIGGGHRIPGGPMGEKHIISSDSANEN